jgi:hypothetical protein
VDLAGRYPLMERAVDAPGQLKGGPICRRMYLCSYRQEAVLSSQIEGMQSSLNDLLLFENSPKSSVRLPAGKNAPKAQIFQKCLTFKRKTVERLP